MTRERAELVGILVGTALLAGYTALFVVVAYETVCLFAIAPPHYYLAQRLVASASLAGGVFSVLRARPLTRRTPPDARALAYVALAVVLFLGAGVRFFFVGFVGGGAMCFYLF